MLCAKAMHTGAKDAGISVGLSSKFFGGNENKKKKPRHTHFLWIHP